MARFFLHFFLTLTSPISLCTHQIKTVSANGEKDPDGYGALKDPQFEETGYADMVSVF